MENLINMIQLEWLKAYRSRIPLWTTIGAIFLPSAVALMIIISRNPEVSRKLGVISAKADLIAFSATDWSAYLILTAQILAAAGFFMFVVILAWIFGREFADGTLKDLLAVPVPRTIILLAKFLAFISWSFIMTLVILIVSLLTGAIIGLPGGSNGIIWQGSLIVLATAGMVMLVVIPFALLASVGRGYLLPLSMGVLTLILANVAAALGRGDVFPWSIPGLYSQNTGMTTSISYIIVLITGLLGWYFTNMWWSKSDQNR